MADPQPPRPAPTPAPDRHQIDRLNSLYDLNAPSVPPPSGWRARVIDRLRSAVAGLLFRQQEFNAAVVDHLNRNTVVGLEFHQASEKTIDWVHRTVLSTTDRMEGALDEVRRYQHALAARERRSDSAVAQLASAHEELRASVGVLHQAAQNLKREFEKQQVPGSGFQVPGSAEGAAPSRTGNAEPGTENRFDNLDSHK